MNCDISKKQNCIADLLALLCGLGIGLAGASIGKEVIGHYYEIKNYLNGYPMRVNMTGKAPNWILIGVCCVVSVICFIILHRRKAWRAIPKDSVPKRYRFELPAVLILGVSTGVFFRIVGGVTVLQFEMSAMRQNGELVLGCAYSIKELLGCLIACLVALACTFFVDTTDQK